MKIENYHSYKHDQKKEEPSYWNRRKDRAFYREYLSRIVLNSKGDERKLRFFKHPLWNNNISNEEKYNLYENFLKQASNNSVNPDVIEFKFLDEYLDHIIDTDGKYKNFKMEQRERDVDRLLKNL